MSRDNPTRLSLLKGKEKDVSTKNFFSKDTEALGRKRAKPSKIKA